MRERVVLLTGAGRGIGLAAAHAFLRAGCKVIALDKDFSECDLPATSPRVLYDLAAVAGIADLVGTLGQIDVLVNNAATLHGHAHDAYPWAAAIDTLTVNLHAPVALIEAVAPQMLGRREGRIVNVCSAAAYTGHPDLWYGASKAALVNVTKSYSGFLGPSGVLVNAVAPGLTQTAMLGRLPEARREAVLRAAYSGRFCTPDEIAAAIIWLGIESPSYLNGATIDVNGGSYLR